MIPLRDQELIRQRFQRDLKSRLRIDFFTQKPSSFYVPGRECRHCETVQAMLQEIAGLSPRISLTTHELEATSKSAAEFNVDRVPAIVMRGQANRPLRFFGLPSGHQFGAFIEALVETASGTFELQEQTRRTLRRLKSDVRLQVLVAPNCPHSASMAQLAYRFGLFQVRAKVSVIEVLEFPPIIQRYAIRAVPVTVIDEQSAVAGALDEATLAQNLLLVAEGKPAKASPTASVTPLQQPGGESRTRTSPSGIILPA
jgi:glutaredoxin-like protein